MDLGYAKYVVEAHQGNLSALGSFEPPSLRTVIAAETVKEKLLTHDGGSAYNGSMAVSVTEVKDLKTADTAFVVAFSGDHPGFKPDFSYTTKLREYLAMHAESNGREKFWFATDLDKVYSPMHVVSQNFFKLAFTGFSANTAITLGQITSKIAAFKEMFDPSTQLVKEKSNLSKKLRKGNFAGVIGGALALRMNIVRNADVPGAVTAVRGFIRYLKTTGKGIAKWAKLARFMEEVLTNEKVSLSDGPTPDTKFLAFDTALGDSHLKAVLKAAIEGWGGGAFGRYCAEPKGYAAVRQLNVRGIIRTDKGTKMETGIQWSWLKGQLAFWYSSDGRTFRVKVIKGPNGAEGASTSGAYMVPCSSCKSRSSEMLVGI